MNKENKQKALERIEALEAEAAELRKVIEAPEDGGKRWRASDHRFFYVDLDGEIEKAYRADSGDNFLYDTGNYFKTEEEAEKYREKLLATQRVKDFIAEKNAEQGWVADWNGIKTKYSFHFDHSVKKFEIGQLSFIQATESCYYGSKETIDALIKEHEQDLKLILGVGNE